MVLGSAFFCFSVLVWIGQISGFPLRIAEFSIFAVFAVLFFSSIFMDSAEVAIFGAFFLILAVYVNPFHIFDASIIGVPVIGVLFSLLLLAFGGRAIFSVVSGRLEKEAQEYERRIRKQAEYVEEPKWRYCVWTPGTVMDVRAKACAECISTFDKGNRGRSLRSFEETEDLEILFERKHREIKLEEVYVRAVELVSASADASDDDLVDTLIRDPRNILDAHEAHAVFRHVRKRIFIAMARIEAVNNIGYLSGIGRCHTYWGEQQRILKEDYGIDWKTPREKYPLCHFD